MVLEAGSSLCVHLHSTHSGICPRAAWGPWPSWLAILGFNSVDAFRCQGVKKATEQLFSLGRKEGRGWGELWFLCIAKKLLFRGRFLVLATGRQYSEDVYQVELIPAQRWLWVSHSREMSTSCDRCLAILKIHIFKKLKKTNNMQSAKWEI